MSFLEQAQAIMTRIHRRNEEMIRSIDRKLDQGPPDPGPEPPGCDVECLRNYELKELNARIDHLEGANRDLVRRIDLLAAQADRMAQIVMVAGLEHELKKRLEE